ncbi:MAG: hypothetical protein JW863_06375 [Chitinispirillaceae bacterium]|nr:hypothetical protein [Chitinispirillaceae bacterium]
MIQTDITPDKTALAEIPVHFASLAAQSSGFKAQLGKRISNPEDLVMVPALYKLFPGITPTKWHLRIAFVVPFLKHSNTDKTPALGTFIGILDRQTSHLEKRVLQFARAGITDHSDMIYLRRLLIYLKEPTVNWNAPGFGSLFSINEEKNEFGKKLFVEQYFIARENTGKGE